MITQNDIRKIAAARARKRPVPVNVRLDKGGRATILPDGTVTAFGPDRIPIDMNAAFASSATVKPAIEEATAANPEDSLAGTGGNPVKERRLRTASTQPGIDRPADAEAALADANARIAELTAALAKAERSASAADRQGESYRARIKELEREAGRRREEAAVSADLSQSMLDSMTRLQGELDAERTGSKEASRRITALEATNKDLESKADELRARLAKTNAANDALEVRLDEAKATMSALERSRKQELADTDVVMKEYAGMLARACAAEAGLASAAQDRDRIAAERDDFASRHETALKRLEEATGTLETETARADAAEKTRKETEAAYGFALDAARARVTELEDLTASLMERLEDENELHAAIASLNAAIAERDEALSRAREDAADAHAAVELLRSDLDTKTARTGEPETATTRSVADPESGKNSMKRTIEELERASRVLRQERDEAKARNMHLDETANVLPSQGEPKDTPDDDKEGDQQDELTDALAGLLLAGGLVATPDTGSIDLPEDWPEPEKTPRARHVRKAKDTTPPDRNKARLASKILRTTGGAIAFATLAGAVFVACGGQVPHKDATATPEPAPTVSASLAPTPTAAPTLTETKEATPDIWVSPPPSASSSPPDRTPEPEPASKQSAPAEPTPTPTSEKPAPATTAQAPEPSPKPGQVTGLSTDIASTGTRVTFTVTTTTDAPVDVHPAGTVAGQSLPFEQKNVAGQATFTVTINLPSGRHAWEIRAGSLVNNGQIAL